MSVRADGEVAFAPTGNVVQFTGFDRGPAVGRLADRSAIVEFHRGHEISVSDELPVRAREKSGRGEMFRRCYGFSRRCQGLRSRFRPSASATIALPSVSQVAGSGAAPCVVKTSFVSLLNSVSVLVFGTPVLEVKNNAARYVVPG